MHHTCFQVRYFYPLSIQLEDLSEDLSKRLGEGLDQNLCGPDCSVLCVNLTDFLYTCRFVLYVGVCQIFCAQIKELYILEARFARALVRPRTQNHFTSVLYWPNFIEISMIMEIPVRMQTSMRSLFKYCSLHRKSVYRKDSL